MLSKADMLRKSLSTHDLGRFGLEDIAYIKTVTINGQRLHAIHAADGTPLTVVNERSLAFATVRQHDMQPASVH
ncbi:MAG: DUF1150 family protein [Alphaproteobacteria bacterium]|nr:DUF1150 family protein [Alphaproteobacteria bacterium]